MAYVMPVVDISKHHISRNVLATVAQVVVSSVVLFALYRYLLDQLGVEQIGVWSIVLATVAVSRIGDLGLSAGIVPFVAQALANDDRQRAAVVLQTVVLTLGVLMAALLIAGFPILGSAVEFLLPVQSVSLALAIVPYALFSLWGTVISSVIMGGLDGCQRIDLRSMLVAVFHLLYLGLTILWVPTHGLEGAARAQVAQSFGLVIASWWVLRRQLRTLPFFPIRWRLTVLKGMLGYGVSYQTISVLAMLFDPVTKGLMSKFGGLAPLGYYEMANKLILQIRAVIVESNRVVIPIVARLKERANNLELRRVYETSLRILLIVSVTCYAIVVLCSPLISLIWIGRIEETFVVFLVILSVGWFFNTLTGPAYFHNVGTGHLKWNMIAHAVIALLNLLLGSVGGLIWGGTGVVGAFIVSLTVGSMALVFSDKLSREVVVKVLRSEEGLLLFVQLVVTAGGFLLYLLWTRVWGGGVVANLFLMFPSVLVALLAWVHWQRNSERLTGSRS